MPRSTTLSPNVAAFLDTIAASEIGASLLALPAADDGYAVLVGATPARPLTFGSYARHPGDPALGTARYFDAALDSTAAGRYQINWPTYEDLITRLWPTTGRTTLMASVGFDPMTQDALTVEKLREVGALDLVEAGQFDQAVLTCGAHEAWASFPGSTAGQHLQKMEMLRAAFVAAGGVTTL
jgi:muramidase (phage lysozyme)